MTPTARSLVIALTLAALAYCTAAEAQSLSRAELEFGGWLHDPSSTFTVGVTGWINDRSGVAVRSFVWRGILEQAGPAGPNRNVVVPGFELLYNRRGFVGEKTEVNFGVGYLWWRDRGDPPADVNWFRLEKVDILFGRRFLDRVSVKGGASVMTSFLSGLGITVGAGVRFLVTVPLGEQ